MNSLVTVSWRALVGIFAAGFVTGWLAAKTRLRGSLGVSFSPAETSQMGASFVKTKTVRTLELKCQCGAVFKFREAGGLLPSGFQPFPAGDSFTCPNCGKVTDLNQLRKIEQDAEAELMP